MGCSVGMMKDEDSLFGKLRKFRAVMRIQGFTYTQPLRLLCEFRYTPVSKLIMNKILAMFLCLGQVLP